ncbi:hypothetical protein ACF07D_15860 [Leucobacter sp. NPDC015123]|uniref:hypothetical protein n=1 Tax=Leucobacter sp. NPDC015123 TaxID=3364129 RepID=UPI0036F4A145
MRRSLLVTALTLCAVLVTGCAGDPEPTDTAPSPTADAHAHEHFEDDYGPIPSPSWEDSDRAAAITAAETAMRAYARPTITQEEWWADMEPLLNQQASIDYAWVQPQSIPATKVTGPGSITDDESALVVFVDVPTDAGTYNIILNRDGAGEPWLVARFVPPETAGN